MMGFKFKLLLSFSCLIVISACSTTKNKLIPTDNNGGYKIYRIENFVNADSTKIHVFGKVMDVSGGSSISQVQLSLGCLKTQTSLNGEYSFWIKPTEYSANPRLYIKTISIGYKSIETKLLNFSNKSILNIDFYLAEEDKPFINCEGKTL